MSDEITFPPMKGSGSSVAAFAIGADGSTLVGVPNSDTVVAFINMRDEIERLRARVEDLTDALIDARFNGLIYWSPMTERGAVERAKMMARIDKVLNKEVKP
jgi:hypothetical protein